MAVHASLLAPISSVSDWARRVDSAGLVSLLHRVGRGLQAKSEDVKSLGLMVAAC